MGDMAETVVPKSDQMNAEDLISGPRTFTIARVQVNPGSEQPVWVWFHEFSDRRPFKPSKTVRRIMISAWGDESKTYAGKRITLYNDPDVQWAGEAVGGIRVSHMSGIDRPMRIALAASSRARKPWIIEPLPDAPPPSRAYALAAALRAGGHRTPAAMLAYCRSVVPRPIKGADDLTPKEIDQVLEALAAATSSAPPAAEPGPTVYAPDDEGRAAAYAEAERRMTPAPGPMAGHVPTDAELEAAYEAEVARREAEGDGRG
jgi:hypothetical protein